MKFKKVEISAFRIYDKPEDSTFDFTTNSGITANFVSLYAPNGFGKTSFYDAVEWGITNNIQRFWQKSSITEDSIQALKGLSPEQVKLIRNTNSSRDTKSFVKITTDTKELSPRVLNIHGRRNSDICGRDEYEEKGFRSVILSQEWISGFLKEVNGSSRYQIFMGNPELAETESYYRNVKSLCLLNSENIDKLNSDIDEYNKSIKKIDEENLLDKINNTIELLNKEGEDFKLISSETANSDALALSNKITDALVIKDRIIKISKLLIEDIEKARIGAEDLCSFNSYFDSLEEKVNLKSDLEHIDSLAQKFNKLNHIKNIISSGYNSRASILASKESSTKILNLWQSYELILSSISKNEFDKNQHIKLLEEKSSILRKFKSEETEINIKLEDYTSQQIECEATLKIFPKFKANYLKAQEEQQQLEGIIEGLQLTFSDKADLQKLYENEINNLNTIISEIAQNVYPELSDEIVDNYNFYVKEIKSKRCSINDLREVLKNIDLKINKQNSLNSIITEFIKKGLEIVNESKISNCPLCNQSFNTYVQLSEQIAENHLLDDILKDLLRDKNITQEDITRFEAEIKSIQEAFIETLTNRTLGLRESLSLIRKDIHTLELAKKDNISTKEDLTKTINEYNKVLKNLSLEEYEIEFLTSHHELKDKIDSLVESKKIVSHSISLISEEVNELKAKIFNFNEELNYFQNNEGYLEVSNWYKTNFPNEIPSYIHINNLIQGYNRKIDDLSNEIEKLEISEKELISELSRYSEEELIKRKREILILEEQRVKETTKYEAYLKKQLQIDENLNKKQLRELLIKEEKQNSDSIKKQLRVKEELIKLDNYSKNLLPFLESEDLRKKIEEKKSKLDFLTKSVSPLLEAEKNKITNYLNKKIEGFFYTDLINDIYRKIDPHPDFKAVEFRANFDSENPTLDVLVTDSSSNKKLIPNLYFSTAQINILSLSIFLASALNSKEYDCIFIDDPIQSMDSINVLSTIDLLRGIVINEGKQIIISTHDENFHNLLKKKLPPGLFASKFLELETFGKVKPSSF